MKTIGIRTVLLLCGALTLWSCDESLPPRVDPEVVLVPSMALSGNIIRVEEGTVTSGGNLVLSMRNVYDEVLSENSLLRANVILRLREYPDSVRTLVYGYSDLLTQGVLVGKTLTLAVQGTAEFVQPWDHRTPAGTAWWELGMHYHTLYTDKGERYYQSDSLHLIVNASLQIFERVQAAKLPPHEFVIIYQLWRMTPPTRFDPSE